jgi:beta-1,2-mannosidase
MKQKISDYALMIIIYVLMISCQPKKTSQSESSGTDTSWALLPFIKVDSMNPILNAGNNEFHCPVLKRSVNWEEKDVFNPAAVVRDGKVYLLYRAEDKIGKHAGTSRIGLAVSEDGLHFTKRKEPVLFPDNDSLKVYEWEGGIEDPRVVEMENGQYLMTYTAYDGTTARLLLATSPDLLHWTKHGTMLNGKYKDAWSKSGAVVVKEINGRIVATRINGKYCMYFGDTDLFMASSEDLIHWSPVEENGKLKSVLRPRAGQFDSRLVESGPFAMLTDKGILMIYNSMNLDSGGDSTIAKGAYCAGQALFDANDATQLIGRLEQNFLAPDKPYEVTGQVNQVCFVEGLVHFNDKWFLYYGTADSKIAVAVKQ